MYKNAKNKKTQSNHAKELNNIHFSFCVLPEDSLGAVTSTFETFCPRMMIKKGQEMYKHIFFKLTKTWYYSSIHWETPVQCIQCIFSSSDCIMLYLLTSNTTLYYNYTI